MTAVLGLLRGIAIRPAKRAPLLTHSASLIHAKAGLESDFGRRAGRSQVTILSEEAWRAACEEVGAVLPWTMRRANLLVAGIPLLPLAGSRIAIGEVILEVTMETDPCKRMDEAHAGLRRALTPAARGGVRCRVIAGGRIAVGDEVMWQAAMEDLFAAPETQRVAPHAARLSG
jgi:MOSC domain-containing protein YiiM